MSKAYERTLEGVRIGNISVFAIPDKEALARRKQKLLTQMNIVSETEHFLIGKKPASQQTFLFHTFRQETIDADLICFVEHELCRPLLINAATEHGAILFAILASTFSSPRYQPLIWLRFCLNTVEHFQTLLSALAKDVDTLQTSQIIPFSAIYRRIFKLVLGTSLLDVGTSFGFLPLLIAHYYPEIRVTGCDNNPDVIAIATDVAATVNAQNITFLFKDVLCAEFAELGHFETVTAIHLLEHLTEQELPIALRSLLHVTSRRLILAVPYEQEPQSVYGHHQIFTQQKLFSWGKWCSEEVGGISRYWCEDVMGGMLIIDRK